jgi:hypothetical protein
MRLLYLRPLSVSRTAARLLLVALSAIPAACDKVPLLAPTESTITLSSNTTTLAINGTAEIIATVIESAGTPVHNGTTVTFTASVGVIEPREARTENGVARATFRAGTQSGAARVGAFSGSARAEEVEILVGGAAAQTVSVRLDPPSVPQTGGKVEVIALVSDVSGNRLPGAPVVFSADNGSLGSSSGLTDQNGEARTTLTTSRQTIVRASVADKSGEATVQVVNLPTVSISVASGSTPLVGQPVSFTVTPTTPTGTSNPIQNVVVDFGDGTPTVSLGAISAATPVSHFYSRADTYTVTATVTDTAGQRNSSSTIVAVQRPVVIVSVIPSATIGQVGTPITFTVSVTNPSNVPIQRVQLNYGDGTPPVTLGPTGGAPQKIYTSSGPFTARATAIDQAGNTLGEGSAAVTIAPPAAFNVTLDAGSGDPAITLNCGSGTTYPKTCTAPFIGIGVRVILTVGCNTGLGAGACANAIGYTFNYGDGTTETTTSSSVDHVFRAPGEYVITATVQTNTGASGSQRLTLIVIR